MAGKLTEEQRQEIVRRYQAGETQRALADELHHHMGTIRQCLREAGVFVRPPGWNNRTELADISEARWRELYWGDDKPSVKSLADQFGVADETVKRHLIAHGIRLRSHSVQRRLDIAKGRTPIVMTANHVSKVSPLAILDVRVSGANLNLAQKGWVERCRERRVVRPCVMCASPVDCAPWRARQNAVCCGLSCQHEYRHWIRFRRGSPRPLIVDRLRELLRQEPYKALPPTYETLEKAGATIGAGEAEIVEVLMDLRNG